MSTPSLGRLESVDPRVCWGSEPADFTPWLAESENLGLLAETLGLPGLQLEGVEVQVGPYRADILCRSVDAHGYVLIENQLARTDHSHLGQILTYAAGLDAATLVWISPHFTEEHRAALDWLNRITGEEHHFFGVQLELWRITGSERMAPRFHMVARPNDWEKSVRTTVRAATAELSEARRGFWSELREDLAHHGLPVDVPGDVSGNWVNLPGGRPDLLLRLSCSPSRHQATLWLLLRSPTGEVDDAAWVRYRHLVEHQSELENAIGRTVELIDEDEGGYGRIVLDPHPSRAELFESLRELVPRVRAFIEPIFAALD